MRVRRTGIGCKAHRGTGFARPLVRSPARGGGATRSERRQGCAELSGCHLLRNVDFHAAILVAAGLRRVVGNRFT